MFAVHQQLVRDGEVRIRRRCDRRGVYLIRKLLERSGGYDAKFIGALLRNGRVRIVDRSELRSRKFRIKARVIFPNVTDAYHANAKLLHFDCETSSGMFCKNHS